MTSKELIPKGTRFGPLVGESYTNETLLKDADRKYFWRVSELHVSLGICVVACEIILCAFQNCSHPVSPSGGCCCCGYGVARASSCGQCLTSCESMTLFASARVSLKTARSDGFKCAFTVYVCFLVLWVAV